MALPKELDDRIAGYADKVARGAQLAALDSVLSVIRRGERDGLEMAAIKTVAIEKLEREWTGPGATRLSLVVDNAVRQAMQLGRVGELTKAKASRPYWLFSAILDNDTTEICFDCDGVCLPSSHNWWATHTPGLHLMCRSAVVSLTQAQAMQLGITKNPPAVEAHVGFGTMGDLCSWEPQPGQYEAGEVEGFGE